MVTHGYTWLHMVTHGHSWSCLVMLGHADLQAVKMAIGVKMATSSQKTIHSIKKTCVLCSDLGDSSDLVIKPYKARQSHTWPYKATQSQTKPYTVCMAIMATSSPKTIHSIKYHERRYAISKTMRIM